MNLVKTGFYKLSREKILNPQYTYSDKGINYKYTSYGYSHGWFTVFEVYVGATVIEKNIRESTLGGKYIYNNGKHKNINYQHNLNTIQYKLKALAEAIVKSIN